MKILALGAHPDDIEIFMYGLLSIYKKEGHAVYTMIATDGAKGGAVTGKKLFNCNDCSFWCCSGSSLYALA